ncbi:unnamed protein product [Heligmosomoides polygyrus]|uniref:Thrombospondin type-1 domain-containing protein 4-like n=1 Tax=Heligmosomoides polygyrus TaxID=6339 RepID=A0A3P8EAC5_HELPZ|nr:unnamed protein product [Heligmosomoides polygyrus]
MRMDHSERVRAVNLVGKIFVYGRKEHLYSRVNNRVNTTAKPDEFTPSSLTYLRGAEVSEIDLDLMLLTAVVLLVVQGTLAIEIGQGVLPGGCTNCAVVGEWSEWSEWASCVVAFETRSQTRYRTCSTSTCPGGSSTEARPCVSYEPPAVWGEWGPWSGCSASCGGGTCTRQRLCNNGCSSCQCVGAATETQTCNTQPCCEMGPWSAWSECSVTCGTNGITYRTRQCSCIEGCVGATSEQMVCNAAVACVPVYEPPPPVQPPPLCITCYETHCYVLLGVTCITCRAVPLII